MTLILTRADVLESLDVDTCVAAVEHGLRAEGLGATLPSGVAGTHAASGGFHVKTAGLLGPRPYYAAKINANFPENPRRHRLPTIQGVIALHDGETGALLALLDSTSVTALRTAAATAVAAKYLARAGASIVAIAGCGVQGRSQLRALARVRSVSRAYAYDVDPDASERFAAEMRAELSCELEPVREFGAAAAESDVVVTCTPSRRAFLSAADVRAGAFVAAVGADSEDKQELDPSLLAASTVVVDSIDQCAAIGELHHALVAGLMCRDDVHATLADVVSGRRAGRTGEREITVFDSTGTGLEDVAAASVAYERALALDIGQEVRLES